MLPELARPSGRTSCVLGAAAGQRQRRTLAPRRRPRRPAAPRRHPTAGDGTAEPAPGARALRAWALRPGGRPRPGVQAAAHRALQPGHGAPVSRVPAPRARTRARTGLWTLVLTHTHTETHTRAHTLTFTLRDTHVLTHSRSDTHMPTLTHAHSPLIHMPTLTHAHTHSHSVTHTCAHAHSRARALSDTHMRTLTRSHTHTHTPWAHSQTRRRKAEGETYARVPAPHSPVGARAGGGARGPAERAACSSCSSPAGATPLPSAGAAGGHSGQRPRLLEPVGSLLPAREVSVTASLKFV